VAQTMRQSKDHPRQRRAFHERNAGTGIASGQNYPIRIKLEREDVLRCEQCDAVAGNLRRRQRQLRLGQAGLQISSTGGRSAAQRL
jgi:hypothetical protein